MRDQSFLIDTHLRFEKLHRLRRNTFRRFDSQSQDAGKSAFVGQAVHTSPCQLFDCQVFDVRFSIARFSVVSERIVVSSRCFELEERKERGR